MSRRVVDDTKETTDDMDTAPKVQGEWRKPNAGKVGNHARGICGIHRKTCVLILNFFIISRRFSPRIQKFFFTKLQMLDHGSIIHIPPESTSCTDMVIVYSVGEL